MCPCPQSVETMSNLLMRFSNLRLSKRIATDFCYTGAVSLMKSDSEINRNFFDKLKDSAIENVLRAGELCLVMPWNSNSRFNGLFQY